MDKPLKSFTAAAACSIAVATGHRDVLDVEEGSTAAVVLWLVYEVSFTCSILVTSVVTFVLIPGRINKGEDVELLFRWRAVVMHNCNVLFMATELLVNKLPLNWYHFPFAMLWGLNYGLFSWGWLWVKGVVYYPFADPTLPARTSIPVLCAIVLALLLFFGIGVGADALIAEVPLVPRALMVYTAAAAIMWTGLRGIPAPLSETKAKE